MEAGPPNILLNVYVSRKMDNGKKYKEAEWKWLPTPTALNDLLFCVNLAICLQRKKEKN